MKTTIYYVFAIIIATACSSIFFPATAQNKIDEDRLRNGSENPFPLTEEQRESLLQEVEKEVTHYRGKYDTPDLSAWEESDRNAYLIAKARRVALMIMPIYYRTYPTKEPTITRGIATENDPRGKGGQAYYTVLFYANPEMEDIATKNDEFFDVEVWEENGEARGIGSRTTRHGHYFFPPEWEDGVSEKIRKGSLPPFRYFTGYELMDPITEKYVRERKRKEREKYK